MLRTRAGGLGPGHHPHAWLHIGMLAWCAGGLGLRIHEHAWILKRQRDSILDCQDQIWGPMYGWSPRWAGRAPDQHTTLQEYQAWKAMRLWVRGSGLIKEGDLECVVESTTEGEHCRWEMTSGELPPIRTDKQGG